MRIALATCSNLPDWEVDDRPLVTALERRGVEVAEPVWDDSAVDWSRFDACLIRTTWDYMERPDEYLAWAERVAAVTRLFNPPGAVRWNLHKRYLRDLEERRIPTVPTVWLPRGSRPEIADILAERGWRRAFLKPTVGATARETLRFDADREGVARAQAHADRLLPSEGLMLQPYLARVETEGERSAIFFQISSQDGSGRLALSHAVVKRPVPGDYRVQDDFGATDAPVTLEPRELEVARATAALVERAGLWNAGEPGDGDRLLYARVDLLRGDPQRDGESPDGETEVFVSELELVEPSLFFRHAPEAAEALTGALLRRLGVGGHGPICD